ncbi:MAG: four helix bundle protein [Gemmatimonadetes bacterium]|nr:four helix bundle protein [Gemmatimonadota bacterium]
MFRMASYLSARCATDASLLGSRVSLQVSQQFVRAVASIAANLAEGYSRGATHDRARFYTYALGSLRETLAWIDALGETPWAPRAEYRDLLIQIRRQLLTAIKAMRPMMGERSATRGARRPITYPSRKSES